MKIGIMSDFGPIVILSNSGFVSVPNKLAWGNSILSRIPSLDYIQLTKLMGDTHPTRASANVDEIPETTVQIHPEAIVVAKACLQGDIVIGPGTIIHPQANINAGQGKIIFGENNIVEETALIQNLGPAGHLMKIGNDNLFEIGSVCHAIEIGDNNVFGIRSTVGPDVKITNGCRIGAKCKLLTEEELPPLTMLHLEHNQRKTASEEPISQKSQTEFLKKLLPKYNEIIRTKNE